MEMNEGAGMTARKFSSRRNNASATTYRESTSVNSHTNPNPRGFLGLELVLKF